MDLSGIWILMGILVIAVAVNRFLRAYLISKALKQSYEENLRRVLKDPNAQPKGRFE